MSGASSTARTAGASSATGARNRIATYLPASATPSNADRPYGVHTQRAIPGSCANSLGSKWAGTPAGQVRLSLRGHARPICRVSVARYRGGFACPRGGVAVHDKHGYRGRNHQQPEGDEWEGVVRRRLARRAKLDERHDQHGESHAWKDHVPDRGERRAVVAPHEHRKGEVGQ